MHGRNPARAFYLREWAHRAGNVGLQLFVREKDTQVMLWQQLY